MADLKSVIEIDVEDSKFKEFAQAFKQYQDSNAKMLGAWQAVGKEMSGAAKGMKALDSNTSAAAKSMESLRQGTAKVGLAFGGLITQSASIAKNITGITLSLAKWAGLTSLAFGAGSAFGMGKLSSISSDLRKTSMGYGVSPGELQAMRINYGKVLGSPEDVLGNIQSAKMDVTKQWAFAAMGINPQGKDAAQLMMPMMQRARSMFGRTSGTEQEAGALGLTQFFSMQELTRMQKMSPSEMTQMGASYEKDRKAAEMQDKTLRKWQELDQQFDRFKTTLSNVMINGLLKLTKPMSDFSASISKAVETIMKSDKFGQWIKSAGEGIETLAKWLTSEEFKSASASFLEGIDKAAGAIYAFAKGVAKLVGATMGDEQTLTGSQYRKIEAMAGTNPELAKQAEAYLANPSKWNDTTVMAPGARFIEAYNATHKDQIAQGDMAGVQAALKSAGLGMPGFAAQSGMQQMGIPSGGAKSPVPEGGAFLSNWILSGLDFQGHWDRGLMDRLWYAESSRGKNRLSKKGAFGDFGFMPDTAKEMGITKDSSFSEQASAAQQYLIKLKDKYKGDMEKTVAAYNWGQGNLDKLLKQHPSDWLKYAPAETQREVRVVVYNETGGNAAVSVKGLTPGVAQ